jgi:hypothetical protein
VTGGTGDAVAVGDGVGLGAGVSDPPPPASSPHAASAIASVIGASVIRNSRVGMA